jgi:hypothetical protein
VLTIPSKYVSLTPFISSPVMDVASGEYGDVLHQLTSIVKNGRLIYNQDSEPGSLRLVKSSEGKALMKNFNYLLHINSPTNDTYLISRRI